MAINDGNSVEICSGLPKSDSNKTFGILTNTAGNGTVLVRVDENGICHAWKASTVTGLVYGSLIYLTTD